MLAVVNNWGAQFSGYWGTTNNSDIVTAIINSIQLAPLSIGSNLDPLMTSGNKQSEAAILDQRANQDIDLADNTPSSYAASTNHNGRRLLPVAIVDPVDPTHTNVIGFGVFLLITNGSPSNYYAKNTNGNSPFCGIYTGPYDLGSVGSGVGGSTGAATAQLVQ